MDDATRQYLINPRIRSLRVPYIIDKAQVLDITSKLLDRNDLTGALRDSFDAYVGACMEYNMQRITIPQVTVIPYTCDNLLLPPKRLDKFVIRKNIRIVHEATHTAKRGANTQKTNSLLTGSNGIGSGNLSAEFRCGHSKNSI